MANPDRPVARVTHRFSAPATAVFDAWLDPNLVRRWMAGAVSEAADGKIDRVEIDARVGGAFTFTDWRDGEEAIHHGTYLEIDRPRRLVFTWLPEPGEHSVVTIDITPNPDGCTLELAHEMEKKWADYVDRTTFGWATMVRHVDSLLGA
jgi:uncharacterized protein YndB with AHSA1/START domain